MNLLEITYLNNVTQPEETISSPTFLETSYTSPSVDNSFPISFKKFHVTKIKENRQQAHVPKELSGFRYMPSVNPCTKKKQEKHFERSRRRIFNKMKLQPGATHKMADKFELSTQDERRKKAQQAKRERQQREQHLAIEAAKQADIAEKKEKPHLSAPVGNISHRVLMRQAD
ncbi:hypothetical protein RhiirA4_424993 [Rhizophagus irregularis]|uniref:DUF8211 domain-containing protein n=1 Tax=Rhizophagus irregularis TaxID=588596 RepID=A0A2I1GZL5_9GLOM|nr:hypothetical protein RhiirA4_424993 [Rhizophagus irregularis]